MLGKGIPQRKNSEKDIDMFIKRHIFACFDDILDTHLYVLLYPQVLFIIDNTDYIHISGEMVFRSSRDRRNEATDAPDKVEGFHPDLDLILEKIYHMADSLYVSVQALK
ncbi:hypothetical protein RhiirA4_210906 [Rhizophagus irregularis]|uniref:Uncharacterized protein n=1 Tax=Rhizophagus irregularis TaxID=588596 RepID=A0A2I1GLQ8_9GLOM|nr:hypothetical protein RhiirA4_210906 [Rhizophagus irregularis]